MADDDWDLYAVVRSCTASTAAVAGGSSIHNAIPTDESFSDLNSFPNDDDSLGLSFGDESVSGLEEIYRPSFINPELDAPPQIEGVQKKRQTTAAQHQHLQRRNYGASASSFDFPAVHPQPIRSRTRKNQQAKIIRHMTQEQLAADAWAWRKYGQKPIKGSTYPRNYYRCSSSKGCAARKQVERCPADPTVFVVSYTGEHTHPRPTHRSSLAGTSRNKLSAPNKPSSGDSVAATGSDFVIIPKPSGAFPCYSSSPQPSSSSLSSPTNPLMTDDEIQKESIEANEEDEDEDENADDVLIPNTLMTEDIFKGFQELLGTTTTGFDNNSSVRRPSD